MSIRLRWSIYWPVLGLVISALVLLTACPNPNQEKSLTQIRSQLSVLSTEMRESFGKSEEERVALYEGLNEDITVLQKNQADMTSVNDELRKALSAIEGKLDEYNTRMESLNARLTTVETSLIERITFLSEQVNEIGRENTISSTPAPVPRPTPTSTTPSGNQLPSTQPSSSQPEQPAPSVDSNPEASQLYQKAYMAYVNGNFDEAIAGFERYLEVFPEADRADLAQYWVAESFFSVGEFETALTEYDTLITQYPGSDRIPAAYFSKADAYLKLDRQMEATSHLRYILNQFPNSTAAQRAEERLRSLQ